MGNDNHRLHVLKRHLDRWALRNSTGHMLIATRIVEEFRRQVLDKTLQIEDIFFMETEDAYTDSATNYKKIFRWLGYLDDGTKRSPARLFFVEQAIVGAMPLDIRLDYINELYSDAGVFCLDIKQLGSNNSTDPLNTETLLDAMIKESSEAHRSVLTLGSKPSIDAIRGTETELQESVATYRASIRQLREYYPEAFNQDEPVGNRPANLTVNDR